MPKFKAVLGYLAAVLTILVVLVTFVGLEEWSDGLVAVTGLKVSPWFSGGDIDRTIGRNGYRIVLRKPVFMGLVGQTSTGFVQAEWTPFSDLPAVVRDEVDYDSDGRNDFGIRLDTQTGKASVCPLNNQVIGLREVLRLNDGWMVRIRLRNKNN